MDAAIGSLIVISLLELLTWTPLLWKFRKIWAWPIIALWVVFAVSLIVAELSVWSVMVALLSGYRIINLLRLVRGRTEAQYLFRVALISSLWLLSVQMVLLAAAVLVWPARDWLYGLAGMQLLVASVLSASTRRHLRTTRPPETTLHLAGRDMPTVTIAIPARNETDDLDQCLKSLTASSYPKLEILVLDDCSQNRRTAEIIRDFAQAGVRFIAGSVPPDNWLAKNYAYHQLTEQSNSEIILFCGVDTRFQPESLKLMVEAMLQKNKKMLSFIPRNAFSAAGALIQPSRYAWELALPRRQLNRPPVLSTCWLVQRKLLESSGGFQAVARKTSPESYFARTAIKHDSYSFLQSSPAIGLVSAKSFNEQLATAVRTRYPQLHRRPELVAFLSFAEFLVLVAPFGLLVDAAARGQLLLGIISFLACLELISFYSRIVALTYRRFLAQSIWLLPFAALYDIGVLNYSLWQYEFSVVIWKGRNVCLPVMRVSATLPQLPDTSRRG